jgi:hypothetical protein
MKFLANFSLLKQQSITCDNPLDCNIADSLLNFPWNWNNGMQIAKKWIHLPIIDINGHKKTRCKPGSKNLFYFSAFSNSFCFMILSNTLISCSEVKIVKGK